MSYNGIGLSTARGSGTNGFIQKNLSTIHSNSENRNSQYNSYANKYESRKQHRERNAKNEAKLNKRLNFQGDEEIVNHERKRLVELQCMELREKLEEHNEMIEEGEIEDGTVISDAEIDKRVEELRGSIMRELARDPDYLIKRGGGNNKNKRAVAESRVSKESIRKNNFDVHAMARQKQIENARFEKAFRLANGDGTKDRSNASGPANSNANEQNGEATRQQSARDTYYDNSFVIDSKHVDSTNGKILTRAKERVTYDDFDFDDEKKGDKSDSKDIGDKVYERIKYSKKRYNNTFTNGKKNGKSSDGLGYFEENESNGVDKGKDVKIKDVRKEATDFLNDIIY